MGALHDKSRPGPPLSHQVVSTRVVNIGDTKVSPIVSAILFKYRYRYRRYFCSNVSARISAILFNAK
jgi:hypothetical protein